VRTSKPSAASSRASAAAEPESVPSAGGSPWPVEKHASGRSSVETRATAAAKTASTAEPVRRAGWKTPGRYARGSIAFAMPRSVRYLSLSSGGLPQSTATASPKTPKEVLRPR
jgi:hypothetical protein